MQYAHTVLWTCRDIWSISFVGLDIYSLPGAPWADHLVPMINLKIRLSFWSRMDVMSSIPSWQLAEIWMWSQPGALWQSYLTILLSNLWAIWSKKLKIFSPLNLWYAFVYFLTQSEWVLDFGDASDLIGSSESSNRRKVYCDHRKLCLWLI